MAKVLISNSGAESAEVVGADGSRFILKAAGEKCEHCGQAKIESGTSVVVDVPDGYKAVISKTGVKV